MTKDEKLFKEMMVAGYGEVRFTEHIPFRNGGGVHKYIIRTGKSKSSVVANMYYNDQKPLTFKVGDKVEFRGSLVEERYQNQEGKWISKGLNVRVKYMWTLLDTPKLTQDDVSGQHSQIIPDPYK